MNNIRKIFEELKYNGSIKDCIYLFDEYNIIPAHRTEQEILKDFEKLGYQFIDFTFCYHLTKDMGAICKTIILNKNTPSYRCVIDNCSTRLLGGEIDIQEHKLLNELFAIYGWL